MIENGTQAIRPRDLAFILDRYNVAPGPRRESLLHLARQGQKKDWTRRYEGRVSPAGLDYASIEADSAVIRGFELYLIPGLLQTENYARAVMVTGPSGGSPRDNPELVEFRMARQKILLSENPPRLMTVVGDNEGSCVEVTVPKTGSDTSRTPTHPVGLGAGVPDGPVGDAQRLPP